MYKTKLARVGFGLLLGGLLTPGCGAEDTSADEVAVGGGKVAADEGVATQASAVVNEQQWLQLTVGGDFTCGIALNNSIWCWGLNQAGQLGNNSTTWKNKPTRVTGSVSSWKDVKAGWNHVCATDQSDNLYCWGLGGFGAIGHGAWTNVLTPVAVPGMTGITSFGTGGDATCAIKSNGTLWCWGLNTHAQLGDGTVTSTNSPAQIGAATDWTTITPGNGHTCGQRTDNKTYCWGHNLKGQVGIGAINGNNETQIQAVSGVANLTQVDSFHYTTCALRTTNVNCWGAGSLGQIGNGSLNDALVPTLVSLSRRATQVSVGNGHSCAVLNNATLECWGSNNHGQLGLGTETTQQATPAAPALTAVQSVRAGGLHTCALLTDRSAMCWGHNWAGQLGTGDNIKSSVPVFVLPRGS
jgi:alpha-tubulin suppressor-like RCC1 family protein